MSDQDATSEQKSPAAAPERPAGPRPPRRGPGGGGGPFGGMGMPAEKAMNFGPSLRRIARYLGSERWRVAVVALMTVASVAAAVAGPKLLGSATNVIFDGVTSKMLAQYFPAGTTSAQAAQALRDQGQSTQAGLVESMKDLVVGHGVDFHKLAVIVGWVIAVYVASSVFQWIAGRVTTMVVQNTVRRLRDEVEAKLHRLPLSYFDKQARGEVLSRVTNDIDNVAQSMQQTLSQLINAVLTVVGVLVVMFWISPLLAVIALATVPVSVWLATAIAKRSQPQFIQQWASTGRLNAHIEEMFTGHTLVKVYGHQRSAIEDFDAENDGLYKASFKAQFMSGIIQPAMGFVGNLNYVLVAVVGGLKVATGQMSLGDVQAFIQYSRQFTQPLTQVASMMNLLQSGVASAERVFELLDADEQTPDPVPAAEVGPVRGRVAFEDVSFSYTPDAPLIEHLDLVVEPGQTVAIVGPTGAGKTTLVNLVMRFYDVDAGRITLDGVDTRDLTRADLRSNVGMVLQDTWVFKGTIEENLRYGIRDGRTVDEAEFLAATEATHVDGFVRTLPDGYATVLDDEGSSVSAGRSSSSRSPARSSRTRRSSSSTRRRARSTPAPSCSSRTP
ncbi:multidrug ABC transporter ATP-binding protein [Luteimicrobium album]|uniref:Multidrug ABC transporter ATP-binding protein n=1 Tax=Luteimicrobium album TaxID=1054550 RepID=A0ABQ6I6A1_9MICO|nr:multidrug ABC transporter ATP-binding protein [Luteimicrobium album]